MGSIDKSVIKIVIEIFIHEGIWAYCKEPSKLVEILKDDYGIKVTNDEAEDIVDYIDGKFDEFLQSIERRI